MRVVVDLGCLERNGADSLAVLAEEYKPDFMYGFDPSPLLDESVTEVAGVPVKLRRQAAWVEAGEVAYIERGSASQIAHGIGIECFDFSQWVRDFKQPGDWLAVKMDIEGSEAAILAQMLEDETDTLVDELLVEWHGQEVQGLRCPVREWWL